MKFQEVISKIKEGQKFRRPCWEREHYWIFNPTLVNSIGEAPQINHKQLTCDDWEIVDEESLYQNGVNTNYICGRMYPEITLKKILKKETKLIIECCIDKKISATKLIEERNKLIGKELLL